MNSARIVLAVLLVSSAAACKPFDRHFGRGFARELMEDGYRAVSIPVDAYQLRVVRAGDRVDVLATFDSTAGGVKRMMTATMLQNVRVMGVVRPDKGAEKGTLVLKLNPNETQYAALGIHQAELSIALRNPGDNDIYPMEVASFLKFFR